MGEAGWIGGPELGRLDDPVFVPLPRRVGRVEVNGDVDAGAGEPAARERRSRL
jgi:hypothetical protein